MAKEIIFNGKLKEILINNVDIFEYGFKDVPEKIWKDFKNKPNCGCVGQILTALQKDLDKTNTIFSEFLGEDIKVVFPGPIESPIVKEFDNIVEMEKYLKNLQQKGKMIRSATPSPNGKGGFILIVM
jgi:hypothetical protein